MLATFIMIAMIIAVWTLIQKLASLLGKPIGVAKQRRDDHQIIIQNQEEIKQLKEKEQKDIDVFNKYCQKTEKTIDDIYDLVLDTKIDSQRAQLINFAAQLSIGIKFHKDAFDHIYQVHGKYQKLLQEHNMKNGVVDASMKIIDDKFKELIDGIE